MRKFESGATRDQDTNKLDYEGFESPLVTKRFAEYMHKNRLQADGSIRGSDNWQMGIPKESYVKSLVRHMEDFKLLWDGYPDEAVDQDLESVCCAVMFNIQGFLYETIRERKLAAAGPSGWDVNGYGELPVVPVPETHVASENYTLTDNGKRIEVKDRPAFGKFAAGKV